MPDAGHVRRSAPGVAEGPETHAGEPWLSARMRVPSYFGSRTLRRHAQRAQLASARDPRARTERGAGAVGATTGFWLRCWPVRAGRAALGRPHPAVLAGVIAVR